MSVRNFAKTFKNHHNIIFDFFKTEKPDFFTVKMTCSINKYFRLTIELPGEFKIKDEREILNFHFVKEIIENNFEVFYQDYIKYQEKNKGKEKQQEKATDEKELSSLLSIFNSDFIMLEGEEYYKQLALSQRIASLKKKLGK